MWSSARQRSHHLILVSHARWIAPTGCRSPAWVPSSSSCTSSVGACWCSASPPTHHAGFHRCLRRRPRSDRLPAGRTARLRRRSHRGDRQHHPQVGRREQAIAVGRILVLPWAFQRRVRAGLPVGARRQGTRRPGPGRELVDAADARSDRLTGRGNVPHPDRADEPVRRRGHRQGVPRDADRRIRRSRTGTPAEQPWVPGQVARSGDAPGQQAVAPLSGGSADGARVRHRDPGGAPGTGRRHGCLHAALVRHPGAARAVRGRA